MADALVVAALQASGVMLLGKTTVHELNLGIARHGRQPCTAGKLASVDCHPPVCRDPCRIPAVTDALFMAALKTSGAMLQGTTTAHELSLGITRHGRQPCTAGKLTSVDCHHPVCPAPCRRPAVTDAPYVAALKASGAMLLGKATAHELGLGITGRNEQTGTARSPYAGAAGTALCGGSSSGVAGLLAAGVCPIAIGKYMWFVGTGSIVRRMLGAGAGDILAGQVLKIALLVRSFFVLNNERTAKRWSLSGKVTWSRRPS